LATYYVSTIELKNTLSITGTASDADILLAVDAASRMVEEYKRLTSGRRVRYYTTVETRYYTPTANAVSLNIDDAMAVTSVSVDRTGDYSYSEAWTAGTHYVVEPKNNPLESMPVRSIVLARYMLWGLRFPPYPQSVSVTGTFGWSTVPSLVKQATTILAARYYNRRNAPFGILSVGVDGGVAARLPKTDPDVAQLLDAVDSDVPRLFA
jgi:hypothetical protein